MSSLITRSLNFARRHRRKIVVLGIVVGSAALLKRYVDSKLTEWASKDRAECLERLKREQHFESTRKTCRSTSASLICNVKGRILSMCDCESLTKIIKQCPPDRLQLWEKLKRMTFARLLLEVHESALLVTLVNVQLNIIGGYMFVDAMSTDCGLSPRLPRIVQNQYLLAVQDSCDNSFVKHHDSVFEAIERVIGKVSLKEKMTIAQVQNILVQASDLMEAPTVGTYAMSGLHTRAVELLQAARHSVNSSADGNILARILDETVDFVESDDYKKVLFGAIDTGFNVVADTLFQYFAAYKSPGIGTEDSFTNFNGISIPLAKIIPMLADLGYRFDMNEHLVTSLFASEALATMSANIYESFSQLRS